MDWNRKILTVTTSATPPVDVTAPQGSQKTATHHVIRSGHNRNSGRPAPVTTCRQRIPGSDHHRDIRNTREQNNHASPGGHETGSATTAEGHTATAMENGKGDHPEGRTGPLDIIRKMPARHGHCAGKHLSTKQHRCSLVFTGSFRRALEQLFALYTPVEKNRCMPGPAQHNVCCG